jgi:hypothetical protein
MMLAFNTTKVLIESFLAWSPDTARLRLHEELLRLESDETDFYAGIIRHGPGMRLSSDQWFVLLSLLPNRLLRSELPIERMLSYEQLRKLPPTIA